MQALLQLVWGDGFLSPGGPAEIARLLEGSDIGGCTVLDIGCGLGVVDMLLAEQHGAGHIVGIDIGPALIARATTRIKRAGLTDRIEAICVEPGPLPFSDDHFDVVFSKDAIVQIPGKSALFSEIRRVLKPGGRFIASDWLRGGEGDYSAEMLEFFRLEGITYNMASPAETEAALKAAGFVAIEVKDRNDWYRDLARHELVRMEGSLRATIVEHIGAAKTAHFLENWRQLVTVLERGELRPCHLKGLAAGTGRLHGKDYRVAFNLYSADGTRWAEVLEFRHGETYIAERDRVEGMTFKDRHSGSLVGPFASPAEAKSFIITTDWFCGRTE